MFRDIITETMLWFQKALPQPTSKNFHTQLGVHFEEVNEMLMELSTEDFETQIFIDNAKASLNALATHLKASNEIITLRDRERYLDALCDQIVTAAGCAHISDMDLPGALSEVNSSNYSKFDENGNPFFDVNRKVIKGPGYRKADLSAFI